MASSIAMDRKGVSKIDEQKTRNMTQYRFTLAQQCEMYSVGLEKLSSSIPWV